MLDFMELGFEDRRKVLGCKKQPGFPSLFLWNLDSKNTIPRGLALSTVLNVRNFNSTMVRLGELELKHLAPYLP